MQKKELTPAEWGRIGGLKSNGGGKAFKGNPELARLAGKKSGEARRRKRAEQERNRVRGN